MNLYLYNCVYHASNFLMVRLAICLLTQMCLNYKRMYEQVFHKIKDFNCSKSEKYLPFNMFEVLKFGD